VDMIVTFPGGSRVDAQFGQHTIRTDQPVRSGGEDSAPAPFSVFLASIATCAGVYVLEFCQQRGLPTEGLKLVQRLEVDRATGLVAKIGIDIQVPPGFPEKYHEALVRAACQCTVKKHLEHPPTFDVRTVVV
jgi:putative redox protein